MGSDLLAVLDSMAITGGNGVSRQVDAVYDRDARRTVRTATVGGKDVDPERTYTGLPQSIIWANGGDYLTPLRNGRRVTDSSGMLYDDLVRYVTSGKGKGRPFGDGEKECACGRFRNRCLRKISESEEYLS